MEAVPRLPMISFECKVNTEIVTFASKFKHYIANFYNEDPELYSNEIHSLETLRAGAVRPSMDVAGCQMLKKYYCQLHFLKSRFPMEENQACSVYFSWRDSYSNMVCSVQDIDFELMNILYDIGAVHSHLGAADSRVSPEGMKMACTHFQCAAWAFQTVRETYPQMVSLVLAPEIIQFMHLTCLAQAQECILEKSMMDNRKATIIAKVAVQVVDYYKQALTTLQLSIEECSLSDRTYKDWHKYVNFKVAYHKAIALLYQGQQAEEQQKMGERVAFYQAACDQLQEACKRANKLNNQQELSEAMAFTGDVVEGKRKAAKNENEFIYHEDVPEKDALQEVKGASLVKGIAFSVNDSEVSGPDIFARLVPMEAHEACSLYSEQKANVMRGFGELVENRDKILAEFMSSMQLDVLVQMRQASGITQDIIDRAAAMTAKPTATQDLVSAMAKLSNTYHDVEAMLSEIDGLLKEEEKKEQEYQSQMGTRPPSILATDLTREYTKYQEAHSKASDSNQNLHRAMTAHIANLKILSLPLSQLKQQIPSVELSHPEVNEEVLRDMETLISKVEEMKNQRALLWAQLRDAIQNDDITSLVVTRQPDVSLDKLFQQELLKHRKQADLIEQNMAAQENILAALIDTYARFTNTRRYLQDVISKRSATLSALINSYDTYDDLLSKAQKGYEFYNKLETNVTKLLQRIKSTCKVQDEERDQILSKNAPPNPTPTNNGGTINTAPSSTPKLKDYLEAKPKLKDYVDSRKVDVLPVVPPTVGVPSIAPEQVWPPGVRPTPVGSERNSDNVAAYGGEQLLYANYTVPINPGQTYYSPAYATANTTLPNTTTTYTSNSYNNNYTYMQPHSGKAEQELNERMAALMVNKQHTQPISATQAFGYTTAGGVSSQVPGMQTVYYPTPDAHPKQERTGEMYPNTAYNVPGASQHAATPAMYAYQPTYAYDTPTSNVAYNSATAQPYIAPSTYACANATDTNNPYMPQAVASTSYDPGQNAGNLFSPSYVQANGNSYTQSVQANNNLYTQTVQDSGNYGQTSLSQDNPNAAAYTSGYMYQQYGGAPTVGIAYGGGSSYTPTVYYSENSGNYRNYPNTGFMNQSVTVTSGSSGFSNISTNTSANQTVSTGYGYPLDTSGNYINYSGAGGFVTQPSSVTGENTALYLGSSFVAAPQSMGFDATAYNTIAPYQSVDGYASYPSTSAYASQQPTSFVPPSVSASSNAAYQVNEQARKESSNIDLLSGLDFTINQAPLIPQQNKTDNSAKEVVLPKAQEQPESVSAVKPTTTFKSEFRLNAVQDVVSVERKELNWELLRKPQVVAQLSQEVEKFEKYIELLTTKTLNGPTTLDLKWKEIQDKQEVEQQKRSISVARCYPMKNRFPDILPFDQTRVKLSTTKDDYINASYIKDVTPNSPTFIVTQTPTQSTFMDFWSMIWEQRVEIIVCLLSDSEMEQNIYWPSENSPISLGNTMALVLQNIVKNEYWIDRIISINHLEQRKSRTVRHLQFIAWPGSLFPPPMAMINFANVIVKDPKVLTQPVVVHCLAGIGRSGLLCLLLASISEVVVCPSVLPDLSVIAITLCNARKNVVRDREHFKFAYHAFLHFLKEITRSSTQPSVKSVEDSANLVQTIVNDPLNMLDPMWATKKN